MSDGHGDRKDRKEVKRGEGRGAVRHATAVYTFDARDQTARLEEDTTGTGAVDKVTYYGHPAAVRDEDTGRDNHPLGHGKLIGKRTR